MVIDEGITVSLPSDLAQELVSETLAVPASNEARAALPDVISIGLMIVGSSADVVTLTNLPLALSGIVRHIKALGASERYLKVRGPGGEATLVLRDELSPDALEAIITAVWSDQG